MLTRSFLGIIISPVHQLHHRYLDRLDSCPARTKYMKGVLFVAGIQIHLHSKQRQSLCRRNILWYILLRAGQNSVLAPHSLGIGNLIPE